jgi:hypothetical protein
VVVGSIDECHSGSRKAPDITGRCAIRIFLIDAPIISLAGIQRTRVISCDTLIRAYKRRGIACSEINIMRLAIRSGSQDRSAVRLTSEPLSDGLGDEAFSGSGAQSQLSAKAKRSLKSTMPSGIGCGAISTSEPL